MSPNEAERSPEPRSAKSLLFGGVERAAFTLWEVERDQRVQRAVGLHRRQRVVELGEQFGIRLTEAGTHAAADGELRTGQLKCATRTRNRLLQIGFVGEDRVEVTGIS